jgi:hypothetical protein
VDNMHYLQSNSPVHDINTRYENQLHIPLVKLSAIPRGITYSAIKVFNKNDKQFFKSALRTYLLTRVFILQKSLCKIIISSFIEVFLIMFNFCSVYFLITYTHI